MSKPTKPAKGTPAKAKVSKAKAATAPKTTGAPKVGAPHSSAAEPTAKHEPAQDAAQGAAAALSGPTESTLQRANQVAREEVLKTTTGMFGASTSQDTTGFGGLRTQVLVPAQSARPYGGYYDSLVDLVEANAGGVVEAVVVDHIGANGGGPQAGLGELTLHIAREHLLPVMQLLRDHPQLRFEMCVSVSGVHYPELTGRELHAVYHLLSLTHGSRRIRVEVSVPDADPHIPSVVSIYPGADWHERETWDMFGVIFDGHPALTRILMPDDWPGHPQRKDYPLGGIPVEYKGGTVPAPDQRRSYGS